MNKLKVALLGGVAVFALSVPTASAWGCGPGVKCPTTTTTVTVPDTTTTTSTTVPETTTTSTVPETTTTTTVPTELAPPVSVVKPEAPIKFTG